MGNTQGAKPGPSGQAVRAAGQPRGARPSGRRPRPVQPQPHSGRRPRPQATAQPQPQASAAEATNHELEAALLEEIQSLLHESIERDEQTKQQERELAVLRARLEEMSLLQNSNQAAPAPIPEVVPSSLGDRQPVSKPQANEQDDEEVGIDDRAQFLTVQNKRAALFRREGFEKQPSPPNPSPSPSQTLPHVAGAGARTVEPMPMQSLAQIDSLIQQRIRSVDALLSHGGVQDSSEAPPRPRPPPFPPAPSSAQKQASKSALQGRRQLQQAAQGVPSAVLNFLQERGIPVPNVAAAAPETATPSSSEPAAAAAAAAAAGGAVKVVLRPPPRGTPTLVPANSYEEQLLRQQEQNLRRRRDQEAEANARDLRLAQEEAAQVKRDADARREARERERRSTASSVSASPPSAATAGPATELHVPAITSAPPLPTQGGGSAWSGLEATEQEVLRLERELRLERDKARLKEELRRLRAGLPPLLPPRFNEEEEGEDDRFRRHQPPPPRSGVFPQAAARRGNEAPHRPRPLRATNLAPRVNVYLDTAGNNGSGSDEDSNEEFSGDESEEAVRRARRRVALLARARIIERKTQRAMIENSGVRHKFEKCQNFN